MILPSCTEMTVDLEMGTTDAPVTLRLWIDQKGVSMAEQLAYQPYELIHLLELAFHTKVTDADRIDVIVTETKREGYKVNAVQIIRGRPGIRTGVVAYTTPFCDVHG